MGTWDTGIFDDDTALDAMEQAMDTTAQDFIAQVTSIISDDEYLDFERAHQLIIAAAIVDHLLNGSPYAHNDEGFESWLEQQSTAGLPEFKPALLTGLHRVLSDQCELNELWQENSVEYPVWRANVENIIGRLQS